MNAIEGLDWHTDGYASLSGVLLSRYRELDAGFRGWAAALGAVEHQFPTLIALADLQPVAYLRSFPHLANFTCSRGRETADLRRFAEQHGAAGQVCEADGWEPMTQLLTPAACYHIYPRLAGRELNSDLVLTTACACHRREKAYRPLRRQWCFNMRELVCIGSPERIESFIEDAELRIADLLAQLGIDADWRIASDPFFDPCGDPKALSQQVAPTKRELQLADGLAIASTNRHRGFFTGAYEIRQAGRTVHSACVAFGLERWLFALSERHGPDASSWPSAGCNAL